MKKHCILLFFLILSIRGFGQFIPGFGDDKIVVQPNIAPQRTIIKLSLLAPFELENTIRVGVEVSFSKHVSIEPEFGYIFNYLSGTSRDKIDDNYFNTNQRVAFRYYVPSLFLNGFYISPLLSYKNFSFKRGVWRNLVKNMPDSTWFLDYSDPGLYHETDLGAYFLLGIQPTVSRHFTLDLNGGVGFVRQQLDTKFDTKLTGGAPQTPAFFRNYLDGIFALHVGYVF